MVEGKESTMDKIKGYEKRFGLPALSGFLIFFLLFLLLINIPPIPLPFTDNKLYLINQPFAETAKFYLYSVLYFVFIYAVFSLLFRASEWLFSMHKKFISKFKDYLASLT